MNSLMAFYDGRSVVLSKFVAMKMLNSVTDYVVVEKAKWVLPYYPPLHGWVTEMEVLHLARTHTSMMFRNVSGGTEKWPLSRPNYSRPFPSFISALDPCLTDVTLDWLVPEMFTQDSFDAIYRVSVDTVRVIQCTIANNHSCNLKYLIPFVEAMNVHVVEMVYVCRRSNFDSFQVPNPQLKPKSKATTNNLRSEHQQYLDLNRTVTKIWEAKCNANGGRSSCPDPIQYKSIFYSSKT